MDSVPPKIGQKPPRLVGKKRDREEEVNEVEADVGNKTHSTKDTAHTIHANEVSKKRLRLCIAIDCNTRSQGANSKCVAHGGGQRYAEGTSSCDNLSRKTNGKCTAHGGGRRCDEPGCDRLGVGSFANALLMEAVCVAMSRDVIKEALGAVANVVPTEVVVAAVKKDAVR